MQVYKDGENQMESSQKMDDFKKQSFHLEQEMEIRNISGGLAFPK